MKQGQTWIAGKCYQKHRVIMLRTNEHSKLNLNAGEMTGLLQEMGLYFTFKEKEDDQVIEIYVKPGCIIATDKKKFYRGTVPQYLYLVNDELPKQGEWVHHHHTDDILKVEHVNNGFVSTNKGSFEVAHLSKISATTNPNLHVKHSLVINNNVIYDGVINLPRPSDSFIKKVCEYKNTNKELIDVLIEMQMYNVKGIPTSIPDVDNYAHGLNISPDNTITIKPIKKTYTAKEVGDLLMEFSIEVDRKYKVNTDANQKCMETAEQWIADKLLD